MDDSSIPRLSGKELILLASRVKRVMPCNTCATLVCPGWESLPATFDHRSLQRVATLRNDGGEEPTFSEHHPAGTNAWSPDAPISPAHFPYNRCDVWTCVTCSRPFLRYTEYGGYYEDARIRELNADLVDVG